MSSHGNNTLNSKGSKGSKIRKARRQQQRHHHLDRHQGVERRKNTSPSSHTSSKRSDHDEENDNICNKNMGTDMTLGVSFCRDARDKKNNSMIEQEKVDKSRTPSCSGLPNTTTNDVHYYSILARIHKAVTSTNNTPSLGSILADANKRGMSLDAVMELYKEERIKVISLRGSCKNQLALEVHSAVMDEEKEADQNEAPWDCDELWASISFDGLEMKVHGDAASEGSVDEFSVSHETKTKDLTHYDPTSKTLSFDTPSNSSAAQVRSVMESWDEGLGKTFPDVSLSRQDDDSENAHLLLKVSSEVEEKMEEINRERRPDPPGLSSEDDTHPDPPGLSLDDSSDADSLFGQSMSQAHKDIFDNCVEIVLKERSKQGVTGLAQKHTLNGSLKDAEVDVNVGLYDTHPDPPGHSYSSTIDSGDMESSSCYSSLTTHEPHEVFVCTINSFDSKERVNGAIGYDNETSHSDDRRRSNRDNSSTARVFVDDRKCIKNKSSKDAQGKEKSFNDEKRSDTQQLSTSSESDSDTSVPCSSSPTMHEHRDFGNNIEIILKHSSESEVAEPKGNFSNDVGSYHYFKALEGSEDNLGTDDVQLMNENYHDSEGDEDVNQIDLLGLASSSSQEGNADDFDGFTPRNPQDNQDFSGDGVDIVSRGSLEDSIEDKAEMSQHSEAASTQGDNDDKASILGTDSDIIRGDYLKDIGGSNRADQELRLDMQQHAAYSTCETCNGPYLGSGATHEYQDDFDNGIEVVLEESSNDETAELSCFTRSETCSDASAPKPQKKIDHVDISSFDLDNMKLWKAISNDTEEGEDEDQTYHSDLLMQASSSTIESYQEDSSSCSGSSSEELQDGASHSTSDEFHDDVLELSRIVNQATTVVHEAIGITESEAAALELSDSMNMNATVQAHHKEQQELACMSDASSSRLDDSQLEQSAEKAHELIYADVSLSDSYCDAVDRNEHNPIGSRMAENSEVNAFISRFSIQAEEVPINVDSKERSHSKEPAVKPESSENGETEMIMNEGDELNSQGVRRVRNTVINHRLRNNAELATESTNENLHLSSEVDTYLPNHLGLWKSPWQKTKLPWDRNSDITSRDTTETIASSECSNRRRFLNVEHRLKGKGHSGYSDIDFYSLYEASLVKAEEEDIDQAPWECRDVGQRFLHEKSVESRNWFGKFLLLIFCNFQH